MATLTDRVNIVTKWGLVALHRDFAGGPSGPGRRTVPLPSIGDSGTGTRHLGTELIPIKAPAGAGPARNYRICGSGATVGVISALSRHFCDGCNRVRLTARGELVLCLGQTDRADLPAPLRAGADDLHHRYNQSWPENPKGTML